MDDRESPLSCLFFIPRALLVCEEGHLGDVGVLMPEVGARDLQCGGVGVNSALQCGGVGVNSALQCGGGGWNGTSPLCTARV